MLIFIGVIVCCYLGGAFVSASFYLKDFEPSTRSGCVAAMTILIILGWALNYIRKNIDEL